MEWGEGEHDEEPEPIEVVQPFGTRIVHGRDINRSAWVGESPLRIVY
jgi:hypothetical protein